jgi:hypothetical protein
MKAKIGNVELSIEVGQLKAVALDKAVVALVKDQVYRPVAGKLFPSGKEAKGFKREDAWSQALNDKAVELTQVALGELFDTVVVRGEKHVPSAKAAAISAEDLLVLIDPTHPRYAEVLAAQKAKVKGPVADPAPSIEEATEEVVG